MLPDSRWRRFTERLTRALRVVISEPLYVIATSLSLALGVGANTAVFMMFDRTLVGRLPFSRADDVLAVARSAGSERSWLHLPVDVREWLDRSRSVDAIAVLFSTRAAFQWSGGSVEVPGAQASATLMRVLGSVPRYGRWFTEEEERARAPVVVLSYALWQRHFGGRTDAIGETVRVNGDLRTIIGVQESAGSVPLDAEWWTPIAAPFGEVLVRPKPGVTVIQIRDELTRLSASLQSLGEHGYPDQLTLAPLRERLFGETATLLRLLGITSAVLLALAATNISNMALARALARRRPHAIRVTLGATPGTLLGELIAEQLVMTTAGLLAGLAIAVAIGKVLLLVRPDELAVVRAFPLDFRSLTFASFTAGLCMFLAALAPALRLRSPDLTNALSGRQDVLRPIAGAVKVRHALVTLQVMAAIVSLAGVFLLLRSVGALTRIDPGFAARDVVVARVRFAAAGGLQQLPDERRRFMRTLVERVGAMPGVVSVAEGPPPLVAGTGQLMRDGFSALYTRLDPTRSRAAERVVWVRAVDPGYLTTFDVRVRSGRPLTASDDSTAPPVALVNNAAARLYFGNGGAVGRTIDDLPPTMGKGGTVEVVGVIDDMRQRSLTVDAEPEVWVPIQQQSADILASDINVRTSRPAIEFTRDLKALVQSLDPSVSIARSESIGELVADGWETQRFLATLLGTIAALAVVLSALGLAALVSYVSAFRHRELGIRAALGARPLSLVRLVAQDALAVVVLGVVLGVPAVRAFTVTLSAFLYGISPSDHLSIVGSFTLLILVTSVAALVPAVRAARCVPQDALRSE